MGEYGGDISFVCLEAQSRPDGGVLAGLSPQSKLQAPQIEIRNNINQWNVWKFLEGQPPCTNVKLPC